MYTEDPQTDGVCSSLLAERSWTHRHHSQHVFNRYESYVPLTELRSCVKMKVASWAFHHNEPYGFCGRKVTFNHA